MGVFDSYNAQADIQAPQRQAPQPRGGFGGFLSRIASSAAEPFTYVGGLVDSAGKTLVGEATHNQTAARNAALQGAKRAGLNVNGNQVSGFGNAAKKFAGEAGQLASDIAFPAKGASLGAKIIQGAKVGTLAGGSSALAHNQDVGTGALEGALTGGATGGVLGKLLGGKSAVSGVGRSAEEIATAKQANGIKNPIASGGAQLQKYGTDMLGNKLNISKADAEKFKGPETVARLNREHGLTVHQAAQLHPLVTGGEGVTTHALDHSLHNMGNVNFGDFKGTLQQHLNDPEYQAANLPDGLSSNQAKIHSAIIDKYHEALNPPSEHPITAANPTGNAAGLDAKSAMDMAKNLEKQGYANQRSTVANKQALADLQLKMADTIKSKIYNAPDGQQALEGAKADAVKALGELAQQSGNNKLNSIAKSISEARNFQEYRNVSEPFVNAKHLQGITDSNNFANANKDSGAGGLFATAKKAISKTVSPVAGKVASNVGNKIEDNATGATTKQPNALSKFMNSHPKIAASTNRAGTTGAAAAMGNPPQNQSGTQSSQLTVPDSQSTDASSGSSSGATDASQSNTPFSSDNIQQAIIQDIATTGGKHVSELVSLFNTFGKSQDNLTTNQKNEVVSQKSALDALNAYVGQLNSAGGGEGPLMGKLSGSVLGKYTNPNANAMDAQRIDIASKIAGSLNPRGTVSPVTARMIAESLPSIHDTPKSAQAKINSLVSQIKSGAFSAGTSVSQLNSVGQ